MCGLFGIVYKDGVTLPSQRLLQESAELLSHRGPDGSGLYHEPGLGLAHTRLSLLDLDQRSDQPFWDAEGNHCIVYNGEIYNFREMKEELVKRGAKFRTTSDTEVVLMSLIMDGPQATLQRMRGMFAFAFYDRRRRRLVLARDRFGIKPLLIYRTPDRILFASEVKAMRPWAPLAANPLYVISYLINLTEATRDRSIFQDVDIVPPGSMITIDLASGAEESIGLLDLTQMIDAQQARRLDTLGEKSVIDRLDELLHASVKSMMVADAPVGALCSGGVDSSLLAAIASKYHSNLAIFHADVVGHSEYEAASTVAKHLKLDLKRVTTRDQDFIELTPKIIQHYEWPYAWHPHSVPFLMVSQLVQKHKVKAVMTGEGADEAFLGYPYLAQKPFWDAYDNLRRRLRALVHSIPRVRSLWSKEGEHALFIGSALKQFERRRDGERIAAAYSSRMQGPADRNVLSVQQLAGHLRTLLHRNDRMGMAASIEARFPFLDEPLVGEAINLPYRHKLRIEPAAWDPSHPWIRDKWALRKVADRYLPPELSRRKKQGFMVSGLSRVAVQPEYFRDGFVREFLQMSGEEFDYFYSSENQPMKIKLMMLEVWGQLFPRQEALAAVTSRLEAHASLRADA
jgi:asparagine synthase (glutamine-hydrolysing)